MNKINVFGDEIAYIRPRENKDIYPRSGVIVFFNDGYMEDKEHYFALVKYIKKTNILGMTEHLNDEEFLDKHSRDINSYINFDSKMLNDKVGIPLMCDVSNGKERIILILDCDNESYGKSMLTCLSYCKMNNYKLFKLPGGASNEFIEIEIK